MIKGFLIIVAIAFTLLAVYSTYGPATIGTPSIF